MKEKSEFGKGLCYNLGLFLAHEKDIIRWKEMLKENEKSDKKPYWPAMVLYGAADHFFEFQPKFAPKKLRERCEKLRSGVLFHRLDREVSEEFVQWAFDEAKELLLEIDEFHGVPTIKGDFE